MVQRAAHESAPLSRDGGRYRLMICTKSTAVQKVFFRLRLLHIAARGYSEIGMFQRDGQLGGERHTSTPADRLFMRCGLQ